MRSGRHSLTYSERASNQRSAYSEQRRAQWQRYYAANRQRLLAKQSADHVGNSTKARRWRAKNPDYVLTTRSYRKNHQGERRYRPASKGTLMLDEDSAVSGGKPRERNLDKPAATGGAGGGRGGRAGDIYALFLTARGVPGEEFNFNQDPKVTWVSTADGSREPPDLEDRAAKYLPQDNLILANADFRVFTDMIDRWSENYRHAPGAKAAIIPVVREWFQQQLMEAVLGAHALRGSREWTLADMEKLWSEEALTAVVMPRYHVYNSVKRSLGAKLGTLKDRVA